jgi:hypothetical protein
MRKALAFVSILLFSVVAGTVLIQNVKADPMPATPRSVDIVVQSPTRDKVYNMVNIPLQFSVAIPRNFADESRVLSVKYWLDDRLLGEHAGEDLPRTYSVVLNGLSEGAHSVKVWMKVHYLMRSLVWDEIRGYRERYRIEVEQSGYSKVISFRVETSPPNINVLTSQETFETSSSTADVPLNFTVNEPVSWVGYTLNGKDVVTVDDYLLSTEWFGRDNYQLVVKGVPAGEHSLTVYVEDLGGNRGASEPFNFIITYEKLSETEQTQETSSETDQASTFFLTETIAVGIVITASAAVVSFGLVAYFLRRKKRRPA